VSAAKRKYKPYPKYKDSGVEWLGRVPEHWEVKRFKFIFRIQKRIAGKLGYDVISITQNGFRIKDIESGEGQLAMDYSKYQLVKVGDFAMNHMDLLTGGVDIASFEGVTSPDYRVFELTDQNCEDRYLLYLMRLCYSAHIFYAHGQGSSHLGRWRFPTENFQNFLSPTPPPDEQTAIADFIERECGRMDKLVEKKQEFIELLKEKRQALITHAVTKGFNPDVEMKDSGVEWLGRVPKHWRVEKLMWHFSASKGKNAQKLSKEYCLSHPGEYPVYSGQTGNNGIMASIDTYEFDAGDLGVIFSTTVGAKAMELSLLKGKFSLSQNCMIISPISDDISREFFRYHFTPLFKYERGIIPEHMQASFRVDDLHRYWIALPPKNEQFDILEHLVKQTTRIDKLITKTQESIGLIKERKTALITAAVTGQIDVT